MGTTAQKLQATLNSKTAIKNALIAKGVSQPGDRLSDYAGYINSLETPPTSLTFSGNIEQYAHYMQYGAKGTLAGAQTNTIGQVNARLTSVDCSEVTGVGIQSFGYAFVHCQNLSHIVLPSGALEYTSSSFSQAFKGTNPTGEITLDFSNENINLNGSTYANAFQETGGDFTFHIKFRPTVNEMAGSCFNYMFNNSTGLKSIRISGFKECLNRQQMNPGFGASANYFLKGCTNLTNIEWPDLEVIGLNTSTQYSRLHLVDITNTSVRTMSLPKLKELRFIGSSSSTGLINGITTSAEFCDFITDWYFPQLTLIGRYAFYGFKNTTIHFAAANEAAVKSNTYYSSTFGAGSETTMEFDL